MEKWEYKTIKADWQNRVQQLNELGQEGWELCTDIQAVEFILKRKIQ